MVDMKKNIFVAVVFVVCALFSSCASNSFYSKNNETPVRDFLEAKKAVDECSSSENEENLALSLSNLIDFKKSGKNNVYWYEVKDTDCDTNNILAYTYHRGIAYDSEKGFYQCLDTDAIMTRFLAVIGSNHGERYYLDRSTAKPYFEKAIDYWLSILG